MELLLKLSVDNLALEIENSDKIRNHRFVYGIRASERKKKL